MKKFITIILLSICLTNCSRTSIGGGFGATNGGAVFGLGTGVRF